MPETNYTFHKIMYTTCILAVGIFIGMILAHYILRGTMIWPTLFPIIALLMIARKQVTRMGETK